MASNLPRQRPQLHSASSGTNQASLAQPLRFVTAASLFDGHDASINIIRRMLQTAGVEVIHLGHNRSVAEVVNAAVQEDADGIAISSYQGGHVEYFRYVIDSLAEQNSSHIAVYGGGGGVIVQDEVNALHAYGVARIYTPEDGMELGLQGMISDMISRTWQRTQARVLSDISSINPGSWQALSTTISAIENGQLSAAMQQRFADRRESGAANIPVLGITGTGGSGKSSITDELIRRFRLDQQDRLRIVLLAIDPTRRKTGGALLGDRIRMNAIDHPNIYMRSIATRQAESEVPRYLQDIIDAARSSEPDLIIVETPGIGQGDAGIVPYVDAALYVMTPEFGAQSQLEKIDMLDYADCIAINKFERKGSHDALRDVRKQVQRNREAFSQVPEQMPVYGTIAARFNDDGVTALYHGLCQVLTGKGLDLDQGVLAVPELKTSTRSDVIIPADRVRYLAEISQSLRAYKKHSRAQADTASELQSLETTKSLLDQSDHAAIDALIDHRKAQLDDQSSELLRDWPAVRSRYQADELISHVRGHEIRSDLCVETLSGSKVRKISLPRFRDQGDLLYWLRTENLPGCYPFTAGVFALKREGEDPTRMFAGEGDAFKTNARFKALSEHSPAKRLSTAFDSVTLYGNDPHQRPDIYGKVGNSGVSIATIEDMEELYAGFDLCSPTTSVSMTINGPAPTILAFFFGTAIRQQVSSFVAAHDRQPDAEEYQHLKSRTLQQVRGTVQADILKEDQGQNTCLFSTEFSLKVMGDIQQYFIDHQIRNFYSVSISGYHIAEAGANPISSSHLPLPMVLPTLKVIWHGVWQSMILRRIYLSFSAMVWTRNTLYWGG